MSQFGSSIGEKTRLVLKNPDGTYIHCSKDDDDSSLHLQSKPKAVDALTISDSELQYIVDNSDQFDQGSLIEEFISILKRNQIVLLLLLTVEMSLSIFLLYITWQKRDNSIQILLKLYKEMSIKTSYIIFVVVYCLALGLDLLFYPIGFYALYSKKYKLLLFFSYLALYTGIMCIFVIYFNMLFLILFVMRLVLYTFSRFVVNLVISMLVLPGRIENNQYGTI